MFTFDADALRMETNTSQRARYVRYDGVSLDVMTADEMRAALMELFNLLYGHLAYAPRTETGETTPTFEELVQGVDYFGSIVEHWQRISASTPAPRLLGFPVVLVEGGKGGNDPGIEFADWGDYLKEGEDV